MSIKSLNPDWNLLLEAEFAKSYFEGLARFVNEAYLTRTVYPPRKQVFHAFNACPVETLKVVILGQDPYHQYGQANGLCFSVNDKIRIPPSLKNIFKELETDIPGFVSPDSGNLERWTHEGVLLLNAVLTVEDSKPGSHKDSGWQIFTDAAIQQISNVKDGLVFMLWGNYAISKVPLIDAAKHLILTAAHPSPLARGAFFGCKHFSKANAFLVSKGRLPVNWNLTSAE